MNDATKQDGPRQSAAPEVGTPWSVFLVGLCAVVVTLFFVGAWQGFIPLRYNTLIVLTGTSILGASTGLVGSFAVLRGRALMGDALAHAALPGLCLAAWIVGGRNLSAMLLGALISGLLGVAIISALRIGTRIKQDAAIGIVLSVFFGAGVAISRIVQDRMAVSGLDSYILGKTAGMIAQDVYLIAGVALACLLAFVAIYKEFKLTIFDPDFAQTQGLPVLFLDLFLLSLIALTVVVGLPAVGVILISALLIIPAAAARFWTDRLKVMLFLAAGFGSIIGGLGTTVSAVYSKTPAGPVIVLVGTSLFLLSMLFAPRRGILARALSHLQYRRQIATQDLLRVMWKLGASEPESDGKVCLDMLIAHKRYTPQVAGRLLATARKEGYLLKISPDLWQLTPKGRRQGEKIVRAHDLWELFLTEYPDVAGATAVLDVLAIEDLLPPGVLEELESKLAGNTLGHLSETCLGEASPAPDGTTLGNSKHSNEPSHPSEAQR